MTRSNCKGRKKAMIVGIDYVDSKRELHSPISDTFHTRIEFNLSKGFPMDKIRIYTDVEDDEYIPTRANLKAGIKWLVRNAEPNDSLLFWFSGHGGRRNDMSTISTSDKKRITAEELREWLVDDLPDGCRLTAVFDCCHPGNILDLKYRYQRVNDIKNNDPDVGGESTGADIICWSAALEEESAWDAKFGFGYMSNAFIKEDESTFVQLYRDLKAAFKPKGNTPVLSSSHRINGDKKFIM